MNHRKLIITLWLLLALFIARVLGQLIVVLYSPNFLPPMKEWYSGLMPYKYLLPSQILIIILFIKINTDVSRGTGFWGVQKKRMGAWLRNFGVVYFFAMVIRYVLRMAWYPEEKWTGGTIPIAFHWVLSIYIILVGLYHIRSKRN